MSFIYSNRGWDDAVPAFVVENAAANLCGLNERNYNRQPCAFWFCEVCQKEERTQKERDWVYLSR